MTQIADELRKVLEALGALSPFEFAQGDAISRVSPESKQKVNTSAAWVVSNDLKSAHKARAAAKALNEALPALDRLIPEIELMEAVPLDKDLEPGSCESKGGHGSPVISVLKWDGDLLATPPICHPHQVEIYENVTGILLGLIGSINPTLLRHDVFRVPLRATQHWGVTFAGEDAFDSGICQYVAFRVEDFYFNGGRSKKRCLWIDYGEWQKLLNDRELV